MSSGRKRHSLAYELFWKAAFVVSLVIVCWMLYYATQKIDYSYNFV